MSPGGGRERATEGRNDVSLEPAEERLRGGAVAQLHKGVRQAAKGLKRREGKREILRQKGHTKRREKEGQTSLHHW